jgi:hypothetical protein
MAPSANSGRVLWPKKEKTHKTNAIVSENPERNFDTFMAPLLLIRGRRYYGCA